jgi:hypothetical protein
MHVSANRIWFREETDEDMACSLQTLVCLFVTNSPIMGDAVADPARVSLTLWPVFSETRASDDDPEEYY